MNVRSKDRKALTLVPSILTMNQRLDMILYLITEYELTYSARDKGGIIMTIRMQRKILSEMMTTFIPSLLLMMITYATTFFKPFFFEAALSVNLTTMLVMTTIFISKMEGLPPTSDIKMIDIWLVLCQMVPFAEVVLLTAMEHEREDKKEKKTKRKKRGKKKSKKDKVTKSVSINIVPEADNQHHRNDDGLEWGGVVSLQMSLDGYDEDDSEKWC